MEREIDISQIKAIGLDGLVELDRICRKYNLTYFLAYGTLIGAIRHEGYIPWDDDIDIWMLRRDYDKLFELAMSDNLFVDWKLLSYKNEPRYKFPWTKLTNTNTKICPSRFNNGYIYGVSIDIFPIDVLEGKDRLSCQQQQQYFRNLYTNILRKTRAVKDISHSPTIKFFEKLYSMTLGNVWNMSRELFKLEMQISIKSNGKCCTCFFDPYGVVWDLDDFAESVSLKFEGYEFNAPANYDTVLKTIYGDYMQLPPEDKRIVPHNYKAYAEEE